MEATPSMYTISQRWMADHPILAYWTASWLVITLPLLVLAPFLGVKEVSLYLAAVGERLLEGIFLGGVCTIPFWIYHSFTGRIGDAIYRMRTHRIAAPEDPRHFLKITCAAVGTLVPTCALFSVWYVERWEYLTTGIDRPSDFGQALGFAMVGLTVVVHPIGLAIGSAYGNVVGAVLEKKGIQVSSRHLILGAISFAGLIVIGLALVTYFLLSEHV